MDSVDGQAERSELYESLYPLNSYLFCVELLVVKHSVYRLTKSAENSHDFIKPPEITYKAVFSFIKTL